MFFSGIIAGYFATDLFIKKYWETGKVKSLVIKIITQKKWELHVHHWITGALVVLAINWLGFTMPLFLLGFFDGIIIQDFIYKDKKNGIKWYNVIHKSKK